MDVSMDFLSDGPTSEEKRWKETFLTNHMVFTTSLSTGVFNSSENSDSELSALP